MGLTKEQWKDRAFAMERGCGVALRERDEARLHLRKLAIAVLATPQPMPPRLLELARNVMEGDDSE